MERNNENLKVKIVENGIENDSRVDGLSNTRPSADNFSKYTTINSCIDYLKIRFVNFYDFEDSFLNKILKKLYINIDKRTFKNSSIYKVFYIFDEDVDFYGGAETQVDTFGNYTYFLELKGHALRMFELRLKEHEMDIRKGYLDLFEFIFENFTTNRKIQIKRIDLVIDDYTNLIGKSEFDKKMKEKCFSSFFKTLSNVDSSVYTKRIEKANKGWSWYVGSRNGTHMNVYDKVQERKNRANLDVSVKSWIRYEGRFIESYGDYAFIEVYKSLLNNEFHNCVCKLLGSILDIKEKNNYSQEDICKAPTWVKWKKLLNFNKPINLRKYSQAELEQLMIIRKKEETTAERTLSWLNKNVYRGISLMFLLDANNFEKNIADLLDKFSTKFDETDLSTINNYRVQNGLERLDYNEALRLLFYKIDNLRNISNSNVVLDIAKKVFNTDLNLKNEN